jgi:hypothetical protein
MAASKFSLADFPVVKAETLSSPNSITVFGPPGKGKSVFAASLVDVPGFERVLIVDTEGGSVAVGPWYPEADVVHASTAEAFEFIINALLAGEYVEPVSGEPYQAVIIDTFDKAQERQLNVYAASRERFNDKGVENTYFKWNAIKLWTAKVGDLLHQAPFLVVFVLHSTESDPEKGPVKTTVTLQGSSQEIFPSVSDAVGYFDIIKVKEQGTTTEVRTVDFRPSARLVSKQRFADKLNGIISDPTMEKVFRLIEPQRFKNA